MNGNDSGGHTGASLETPQATKAKAADLGKPEAWTVRDSPGHPVTHGDIYEGDRWIANIDIYSAHNLRRAHNASLGKPEVAIEKEVIATEVMLLCKKLMEPHGSVINSTAWNETRAKILAVLSGKPEAGKASEVKEAVADSVKAQTQMERDAERYRFLRDRSDPDEQQPYIAQEQQNSWGTWLTIPLGPEECDAVIDQHLQAVLSSHPDVAGADQVTPNCSALPSLLSDDVEKEKEEKKMNCPECDGVNLSEIGTCGTCGATVSKAEAPLTDVNAESATPQKSLTELLDQIEQRANAATKGPWRFEDTPSNQFVTARNKDICALAGVVAETADFKFIAAARSDVPKLVNTLRRAVKEFDFDHVFSPAQEKLKAELAQLLSEPADSVQTTEEKV